MLAGVPRPTNARRGTRAKPIRHRSDPCSWRCGRPLVGELPYADRQRPCAVHRRSFARAAAQGHDASLAQRLANRQRAHAHPRAPLQFTLYLVQRRTGLLARDPSQDHPMRRLSVGRRPGRRHPLRSSSISYPLTPTTEAVIQRGDYFLDTPFPATRMCCAAPRRRKMPAMAGGHDSRQAGSMLWPIPPQWQCSRRNRQSDRETPWHAREGAGAAEYGALWWPTPKALNEKKARRQPP